MVEVGMFNIIQKMSCTVLSRFSIVAVAGLWITTTIFVFTSCSENLPQALPVEAGLVACDTNMYRATTDGECMPIPVVEIECDTNQYKNVNGECVTICSTNQYRNTVGACVTICDPNQYMTGNGDCVDADVSVECSIDTKLVDNKCVSVVTDTACDDGSYRKLDGSCVELTTCANGEVLSYNNEGDSYSCETLPAGDGCLAGQYTTGAGNCEDIPECGTKTIAHTGEVFVAIPTYRENSGKLECAFNAYESQRMCDMYVKDNWAVYVQHGNKTLCGNASASQYLQYDTNLSGGFWSSDLDDPTNVSW